MNITARFAKYIGGKIEEIIINNKEIQFYVYEGEYRWRDYRFIETCSEFKNKTSESFEELKIIFESHLKSLTLENLQHKKDKLISKYIGEFKKPKMYFKQLKYINNAIQKLKP